MSKSVYPSRAKELMERHQLFPRKRWGQNFLLDGNILGKIIAACELSDQDYVVEIGPGLGALTEQLAPRCRGLLAIEIDEHFAPVLQEVLAPYPQVHLLFADVLQVNVEQELCRVFNLSQPPPFKVCANIPYNITSPILFQLLENCPHLVKAVLMMQKEVADRILAGPGGKDYGLLTLTTAYYATVEHITKVSRNCFFPRPEVDSSVLGFSPRREKVQVVNEVLFKEFLRAAFQKRRKTMLNICSGFFHRDKPEVQVILEENGISPASRPENLTLENFAVLVNHFAA